MQERIRFVAVHLTGFLCHLDTAVRHESTFERFVCLKADYLFKILKALIDVGRAVCCDGSDNVCFHIQYAALCPLFFLELLKSAPEPVRCLGRSLEEGIISVVRSVVVLNKITDVYALFPESSGKTIPLFKFFFHGICSFLCVCQYCAGGGVPCAPQIRFCRNAVVCAMTGYGSAYLSVSS